LDESIRILELLLAGGVAVLMREAVAALRVRSASQRADRREGVDAAERLSKVSARFAESIEERLTKIEAENQVLEERLSALLSENSVLHERLNNSDRSYAELGQRLQGEIALRTHLQHENEELRTRVRSLEQEVAVLRSELSERSVPSGPEST